jgi:hypothetical protein
MSCYTIAGNKRHDVILSSDELEFDRSEEGNNWSASVVSVPLKGCDIVPEP